MANRLFFMDIKKEMKSAFEASIPSNIILTIMIITTFMIVNLTDLTIISEIPGILFDLIYFAMFLYAGFRATYNGKGSKITAGLAGSTSAAVIGMLNLVSLTVIMIFLMGTDSEIIPEELVSKFGGEAVAGGLVLLIAIMVLAIIMIISVIINFAVGMLGGFVGERLRGKKQ
ncbi:hypothetical protein KKE38_03535 [Candidatus Micrarchaeota archaeon]|nr:hypothetical protein [Candidatus Micrarchaeota archaeon]